MHPGNFAEQKYDQCLKHNFTDCKFEASLRMYTGNSEECERKLQSSPERQQEIKIIKKKMAQDVVTDRPFPVLARSTKGTKKLHSFPSRLSQFPPPPYTSQEEVMRLISSASKLIVAATCEISSEEIKKPDCASPQKRKEAKNVQRLDHYYKQCAPPLVISPDPHDYEAKSTDVFCFKSTWETNKLEESNADFIQENPRNDYGKNTNKDKKEKNSRNVNGRVRVERSSNISSNSSKHKSVFSKTSTRASDLNSLYLSTVPPYAQRTDRSKASKKNVLNEGASSALCSSSVMSECQDTEPSTGRISGMTSFAHSQKNKCISRWLYKSSELKRQKSAQVPSRKHSGIRGSKSSKLSQGRPMENSRNMPLHQKERKNSEGNRELNEKIIHTVSTNAQTPIINENTGEQTASVVALKCGIHYSQNNTSNSLHQRPQSNQHEKKKKDLCELATGKNTESHKVHFQGPLQFSRNTEQKCSCVNLNSCNITNDYGIQTIASESKSLGTVTQLPENENEEHLSRVTLGAPCFLHQVFLEMEQDASPTSTASEPKDLDSSFDNKSIQQLSNQLFILNESTGDKKVQDTISNVHTSDIILTDPCGWQLAHIPQKVQCCCTCAEEQPNFISETSDEEQDSFSDSSVTVTSILGALENQQSEEEFTVSSVSDSLSLGSLYDVHEQMEENNCVDQKEEENSDSSTGHLDQRVLEEMQKISTSERLSQTDSFHFSSTDEEGRANMDHALKSVSTSQVLYFCHFPHYIST
ncbi:uncharacterized protein LOC120372946 isoform X3 [Mauremys reevesii]|nr:uncharacterized protein LOC120372946 isoform X3 [Mauremys reevesii]XP_039346461.1 uncharacterized protein LOC120372946 isoform X3 [Mauremys reevesii]XP_039346462.1 uncharacterized protein LOC120372946 isoform X3 [Mauremys reevesii]